ncbi:ATP-binding protein [Halapricum desulfuricans]|uniref:Putative ATPase, AAA+ superfamily n=1 Tax=Halapricum desulfuricans TaxID=2841257 RepID=A0A897NGX3_9EURY|nr:DUF499 domain-containing protein [Halapricum desulfuricans]QSG09596.1 putative ATPase, AAA+ superfamily [Halapricum desulfuricans]
MLRGELAEDQFAANLASVAFDPEDAAPVYRDADEFYASTYPTDGLQTLLSTITSRFLSTTGREPEYSAGILCLDTTFGGGKTHDMIASYHLASNPGEITGLDRHVEDEGLATAYEDAVEDGLSPRSAVFVGGYVDARNARSDTNDPDAPNTNTMWGEIAYQLYGNDGYEYLKEYDRNRDSPGESTLQGLFDLSDDPALILIDEIAQYLEDASGIETGNTLLSTQTLSFMKSLLETASNRTDVTVVYSIADTAFTDEAETVRQEIKDLDSIEQRQQQTITPTGDTEISSVLRRRLFDDIEDDVAESVATSFYEFYRTIDRQLPPGVLDTEYREKLERNYPFHPTTINTLTDKIDSIPGFQKTRDALRLLARAIYYLWNHKPTSYDRHLLRLYDLTPADNEPDGSIRTKLSNTLFDAIDLDSAVSADIYTDDESAHAQQEDKRWSEKGLPPLGTHVATSVLWNSLAVGEKATGMTRAELYASVAHPEVSFDHYDNALENLTGSDHQVGCYYLYDEDRIKFKAQPRLLYIIDQYTQNTPRAQARDRFEGRLRQEIGTGGFETVPTANPDSAFPEEPADVPDSATTPTLAIMHFDSVTVADGGEKVPSKVQTLYDETASSHNAPTQSRTYKNYVLFLVPDHDLVENGVEKARRLEGLERMREDSDQIAQLTDEQFDELGERIDRHKGLLGEQVRNVYRHLYYPDKDGLEHVSITAVDANGDTTMVEAVEATLDDRILRDDDSARGEVWFKSRLWQQTKSRMDTEQLAAQFAKKPGLPYLFSTKPLRKTVARMVDESGYAYWDGEREQAYWTGDEEPDEWHCDHPISESPDVETSITSTDVKIGDEYAVFEGIDPLVDATDLACREPEYRVSIEETLDEDTESFDVTVETESATSGHLVVDTGNDTVVFSDISAETVTVSDFNDLTEGDVVMAALYESEAQESELASERQRVKDGGGPQPSWEETSKTAAAKRAFGSVRDDALASASDDATPGIETVEVEVAGDSVLDHGFFLAQRSLDDYAEQTTASMDYRAKDGDGSTQFTADFRGDLEDFRSINQHPESFSDNDGQRNVNLIFRVNFDVPEPLDGDDLLASLRDELDGTDITVQVHAQGPADVEGDT